MFHQSKWSRTIDVTEYIVLRKSLRHIRLIEFFGKQLNGVQLLKDAYKLETAEPFAHLIIDFQPRITLSVTIRWTAGVLVDLKKFENPVRVLKKFISLQPTFNTYAKQFLALSPVEDKAERSKKAMLLAMLREALKEQKSSWTNFFLPR